MQFFLLIFFLRWHWRRCLGVLLAVLILNLHSDFGFLPNAFFPLLCCLTSNNCRYNESNERIKEKTQEEESPETTAVFLGITANKHTQKDVEQEDANEYCGNHQIVCGSCFSRNWIGFLK